jgi:branched-chain amino acid transport system substrate-binding protein
MTTANRNAARLRSRGAVAVLALSATLLLAACASNNSSNSANGTSANGTSAKCSTHILLVANFTGAAAQNGQAVLAGDQAAVDKVNKSGGVLGCNLVIDKKDDGSDYTKDLPIIQEATSQYNYPLVLNPDFAVASTASYIARQKLLEIVGSTQLHYTEPSAHYPTTFDTMYLEPLVVDTALQYAIDKGHKRVAVIVDNTSGGAGDIAALQAFAKSKGVTITDTEQVDLSGVNFVPAIERARASNPEVLLTDLYGAASGHLRQQIQQGGWNINIISGSNDACTTFKGLIPETLLGNNAMIAPASMAYPSDASLQTFVDEIKASGQSVDNYFAGYSANYDGIILFAWAANQVHSLDSMKIAAKLHASGDVAIPGLVGATTTGYTPTSGEWNASAGLDVVQGGYYINGQLKKISSITAPVSAASIAAAGL